MYPDGFLSSSMFADFDSPLFCCCSWDYQPSQYTQASVFNPPFVLITTIRLPRDSPVSGRSPSLATVRLPSYPYIFKHLPPLVTIIKAFSAHCCRFMVQNSLYYYFLTPAPSPFFVNACGLYADLLCHKLTLSAGLGPYP